MPDRLLPLGNADFFRPLAPASKARTSVDPAAYWREQAENDRLAGRLTENMKSYYDNEIRSATSGY